MTDKPKSIEEQMADMYLKSIDDNCEMFVGGVKVSSMEEMFKEAFEHQIIYGDVVIETKLKEQ